MAHIMWTGILFRKGEHPGKLQEAGVAVARYGKENTPESFRQLSGGVSICTYPERHKTHINRFKMTEIFDRNGRRIGFGALVDSVEEGKIAKGWVEMVTRQHLNIPLPVTTWAWTPLT